MLKLRSFLIIGCAAALVVYGQSNSASKSGTRGQGKAVNGDWPMFLHDLEGTRYSPLTQINTGNVSRLTLAWMYRFNRPGKPVHGNSPSELYQEVTPIVVNGVMYLPAGDRVVALDPETGKEIWTHEVEGIASFRGVTYWQGDRNNPPRIIFTTGHKMYGLDARTGKIDPGFGKEGEVPLEVAYDGAPIVYKNLLLLGTNFYGPGDRHINPALDQASGQLGDVHGYDVRTGKQLWTFHTIPHAGEPGIETWLKPGSNENRTGNNVWAFALTVDQQHGLLYLPVSGPGANFYGGDRPGNNLFGNALVAVDAQTGKLKWYFQTVHHELWDYNLPPAPSLIDIVKDGKKIPALVQVGKSGYMYILNRLTGKPIFGVEEKPVAKGDVPGEWYAPTQPIPLKPPPISRVSFTKDDMVRPEDTTPEHAKACQALWDRFGGLYNGGPFTPFLVHEDGKPSHPSLVFPGFTGGANWGGTAIDPKLGYIFVNTKDAPAVGWMVKNPKYTPGNTDGIEPYIRSGPKGVGGFSAVVRDANGRLIGNWPCFRPPWGRLIAVNASTGDFAWQVPLGVTDSLPEGKRDTGATNSAGPIATAGGLVFIGSTSDRRFRAFDSRNGKELWVTHLDHIATANPMTYMGKNGKQYVAIVAAGAGTGNDQGLLAYSLP
jgi:glucose dehydrogenase